MTFDRAEWLRVKKMQGSGWKKATIMTKTGWSEATIERAMKSPTWGDYRQRIYKATRTIAIRREQRKARHSSTEYQDEPYMKPPMAKYRPYPLWVINGLVGVVWGLLVAIITIVAILLYNATR